MIFCHNTIKKYTLALLDFFSKLEVQYENENGTLVSKSIPVHFKNKEKKELLDKSQKQMMTGNMNVLPRGSLELTGLSPSTERQTSKYNKINKYNNTFQYNIVSYDFDYTLKVMCRGMTEACQIVEEIAPKFNPNVAIDVYDAENEDEPTRIPLQLGSISIDTEGFEEKSMNICIITCSLKLYGYLFQPVQNYYIVKELKISLNTPYLERELMEWDVVDKHTVNPPKVTSFNTESNLFLDLIDIVKNENVLTVKYKTNNLETPKITWISDTARLIPNGETCTIETTGEFDVSCTIDFGNIKKSIFKEFKNEI